MTTSDDDDEDDDEGDDKQDYGHETGGEDDRFRTETTERGDGHRILIGQVHFNARISLRRSEPERPDVLEVHGKEFRKR